MKHVHLCRLYILDAVIIEIFCLLVTLWHHFFLMGVLAEGGNRKLLRL